MKNKIAELVFIIDQSGSMNGMEKDTIGGFNSVIEKQKKEPYKTFITTYLFNHEITLLHDHIDLHELCCMNVEDYLSAGTTALLDAIGTAIKRMIKKQRGLPQSRRANRVTFVIITDGYENSSYYTTYQQVQEMITKQESKYKWSFIFLGADLDAAKEADRIGIRPTRVASYIKDQKGSMAAFSAIPAFFKEYLSDENYESNSWASAINEDNQRQIND